MAVTFSHLQIAASHAIMSTLPRTLASHFRPTLLSLSPTTIFNHHIIHHYPLHFPIHNFSSTFLKFHSKATNLSHLTTLIEEENNSTNKVNDSISSPHLVAIEYADLNLPLNGQGVKCRQHVNPLKAALSVPAEVPEWNDVFRDSSLPLMVDIGCGSGRLLLWLAKRNFGSNNYLGLEIRNKQLASSYPGPVVLVSILCPDPHFKKRHHKRRVLQKTLADSIVDNLTPGGQVFVQSDVHEVAVDMRNQFDIVTDMLHIDAIDPNVGCDHDGWLLRNPMGIRTEREIHAELEGLKIYRRLYQKRTDTV